MNSEDGEDPPQQSDKETQYTCPTQHCQLERAQRPLIRKHLLRTALDWIVPVGMSLGDQHTGGSTTPGQVLLGCLRRLGSHEPESKLENRPANSQGVRLRVPVLCSHPNLPVTGWDLKV